MTVTVHHVLFVLSLALCCACGCVAAVQQDQMPGINAQLPSPLQPQLLSDIDVPAEYTTEKIRSEADEGMKVIQEALKRAQQASAEATRLYTKAEADIKAAEGKDSSKTGSGGDSLGSGKAKDVLQPAHSSKRTVEHELKLLQETNRDADVAYKSLLANLKEGETKRVEAFKQMRTVQAYELTAINRVNTLLQHAKTVVDASVGALKELRITEAAKPLPAEMVPRVPKPPADVPGAGGVPGLDGSGLYTWVRPSLFLVVAAYAAV